MDGTVPWMKRIIDDRNLRYVSFHSAGSLMTEKVFPCSLLFVYEWNDESRARSSLEACMMEILTTFKNYIVDKPSYEITDLRK